MSGTLAASQALRDELAEILGDSVDLVTLDGSGLKPATRAAAVIFPPEVTYTTWDEKDQVWKFALVAGPADRPLIAWESLDTALSRLEESTLNLASASPATFDLAGAGTLPAFEITLNPI